MTLRSYTFAPLAALALSACAAGPDPVVAVPPSLATTSGPFLSAEEGVVTPTPLPAQWWRLYDDPVLDGLVADALAANTDIRQATARIARARAALRGARSDRLPQTSIGAGADYRRVPETQSMPGVARSQENYDLGLSVNYELDLFGRVSSGVNAARADVERAQADADAVRVMVVADTTQAYADAASAAQRLAVAQGILDLLDASLDLMRQRHDAGLENGLAVAQIEALREQRAAIIPAITAERQAALFALATLTGRTPSQLPEIAAQRSVALEITQALPVGDGAALLARRPDIRAAERQLAADTARIGVATADLYPRITLGGSIGSTGPDLGDVFTGGPFRFLIGSLIDWAFPNTEPVRARIDAAEADAQGSLAAFDGAVLSALQETETALSAYANALEQRRSLQAAVAAAERAANITRARASSGIASSLERLDAERTFALATSDLADLDALISRRQIDVFRALGGGWDQAEQES